MTWVYGCDVWEGNLDIDEPVLQAGGVSFLIPRLNSISGALHKDDTFDLQWVQAAPFIRFPYFVYTPYVSGRINFEWLCANLPVGVKRFSVDVEVRRVDYSPVEYAANVQAFINLCHAVGLWPVIYTGMWFLSYLSSWPTNCEYWWARYPFSMYPDASQRITWAELRIKLDALLWNPACTVGTCHLWQASGDRYKLPGMNDRVTDIDVWDGTVEELRAWVGEAQPGLSYEQKVDILWAEHHPVGV